MLAQRLGVAAECCLGAGGEHARQIGGPIPVDDRRGLRRGLSGMVGCTAERGEPLRTSTCEKAQVCAGGFAPHDELVGVDAQIVGVGVHERQSCAHVGSRSWERHLSREAVVDTRHGVPGEQQPLNEPRALDVNRSAFARAVDPGPTMHPQHQRRRGLDARIARHAHVHEQRAPAIGSRVDEAVENELTELAGMRARDAERVPAQRGGATHTVEHAR